MNAFTAYEVYPKDTGRFGVRFADKFVKIYGPAVQDSIDALTAESAESIAGVYVRDAHFYKPLPKPSLQIPKTTTIQLSFF